MNVWTVVTVLGVAYLPRTRLARSKAMSGLPSPAELERLAVEASLDLRRLVPMYRRLHAMGLEPERRESASVSGGDPSDSTAGLAVDSDLARRRREYARWVAKEVARAARLVDRVAAGLERNVGPGPGYRQPDGVSSDAVISATEFADARRKQAERLRAGSE